MSHTAELIAVGTELLLGSISNTDAQMISKGLSGLGINVYYHTVVGDNPERVRAAVELAKTRADIIITTGGLGPTCDDLTKQAVADAFGRSLVFDPRTAQRIEAYFHTALHSGEMPKNNLQQAMLPEGCTILDNDWGSAPGCALEVDGITVILLPGPPRECEAMLNHRVIPYLQSKAGGVIRSRTLKIFGMGESAVEERFREQMLRLSNPTLAPYAKEGEVELRLTARADTPQLCESMIAPLEAEIRSVLGDLVYGVDVASLEEEVLHLLTRQGKTLTAAESCTGGLVQKRLTDLPGASRVFPGGVVSYSDRVKEEVLGVPHSLLLQQGAVCDPVARAMAKGARRLFQTDLALSVTGVAGPDPDDRGNPVGRVFVALCDGANTFVRALDLGSQRGRVRLMAAHHAFDMVRRYLTGLSVE